MKITRVAAKNFLSFITMDLGLPKGLVAVIGENRDAPGARSNGAGKSSIVDAIAFALYGETTRGVSGDDVVHIGVGGNCVASVEFDDGTIVSRYRKDKKNKNAVVITKGGKPVSHDRIKDAQGQIDLMIGADWTTFRQAVLFGQDAVRFLALTDAEKKAILEQMLSVSILDAAASLARTKALECATKAMDLANGANVTKVQIDAIKREHELRTTTLTRWREERESYKARIREEMHQERARKLEVDFRLAKTASELSRAKEKASAAFKGLDGQCVELEGILKETKVSMGTASESYMKAKENVAKHNERYMLLVNKLESFQGLAAECPACYQEVGDDHKSSIAKDLKQKIVNAKATLEQVKSIRDGLLNEFTEVEDVQKEVTAAITTVKNDHAKADRELAQIETRIVAATAEADREDALHASRIKDLETKLAAEDSAPPDTGESLAAVAKEIEGAVAKAAACEVDRQKILDTGKRYEFWAEGFGLRGLRSMVLDNVLPFLEERANGYLVELTGGTTKIALSPVSSTKGGKEMRDSISVGLSTSHGANSYEGLSGGERQRVDVAMALALFDMARARAGVDVGLVVFDEIFERLDDAGCESVGALLRKNAPRWGTLLLVTHLDNLLMEVQNRIRVVKERGESNILVWDQVTSMDRISDHLLVKGQNAHFNR